MLSLKLNELPWVLAWTCSLTHTHSLSLSLSHTHTIFVPEIVALPFTLLWFFSVWRTKNSIFEWWGVQRAQLRPCLLHNGDRGAAREGEISLYLVYHFQWKIPIFLSLSLLNTQRHRHTSRHITRTKCTVIRAVSIHYVVKGGKWLMHIWIKVQLKDAAPSYSCYSSIRSWNTPFQRGKKIKVAQCPSILLYFSLDGHSRTHWLFLICGRKGTRLPIIFT